MGPDEIFSYERPLCSAIRKQKMGSPGISVAGQLRPEIELPTETQDASPVVAEGAEAACSVLQGLDDAVEALGRNIRDSV